MAMELGAYTAQCSGTGNVGCMTPLNGGGRIFSFQSYVINSLANISSGVSVDAVTNPINCAPTGAKLSLIILCNASAPLPILGQPLVKLTDCSYQVKMKRVLSCLVQMMIQATFHSIAGCPIQANCSTRNSCASCGSVAGCGWCLSTSTCSSTAPSGCSSFVKNPKYCPADPCSKEASCAGCTGSHCIWCLDSSLCIAAPGSSCENTIGDPKYCPAKRMSIV